MKQLKLKSEDIICNIPCCYENNLYNKIKEVMKGYIILQKKQLHINDDAGIEEWGYTPKCMTNNYNHVSITRNIGLENIHLMIFWIKHIHEIFILNYSYQFIIKKQSNCFYNNLIFTYHINVFSF